MTAGARPSGCPTSDVDLWSDDVLADPYPHYRALRDLGPVVWLEHDAVLALPRFADVRAALSDHETFSSASGVAVAEESNRMMGEGILTSDPPQHESHRRPIAAQLSPPALRDEASAIKHRAEEIVDAAVALGRFDGVADVARPYSLSVVADLVGLPMDGREQALPHLAEKAFNLIGPANARRSGGVDALRQMTIYATQIVNEGSLRPGSRGAQSVEAGRASDLVTYTWPGIDTTVNGMSAALWLFAEHPDQWDLLRADPALIPSAWNEVLRMHAPVHTFTRLTTKTVEIDGVTLVPGTRVLVMYGSANRDERKFAEPDTFDVTRNPVEQLAFGRGVHLCVGVHLARLEGHALLDSLVRRVDRFQVAGDVRWIVNNSLHGLAELPLEVSFDDADCGGGG